MGDSVSNQLPNQHTINNNKMKAFIAMSALLAAASAEQTSHQVIKHGSAPVVHAPVLHHAPVHAPVFHRAPVHVAHPAPVHVAHPAPVVVAHPAPALYHPAPAPVYHPAPVVHKPTYKEPAYDEPAVYQYGCAVADDYSGASFTQNEKRDGYATSGEYRVALPDGRTQIVTYSTADGYSGNVADVKYEG